MGREYIILLVEDLADDVRLIREAFERAGVPFRLLVAGDGEEAGAAFVEEIDAVEALIVFDDVVEAEHIFVMCVQCA